ncbi:hypothetical protein Lalb_Chr12g0207941 [Lupinus albus]|uniref:Uncharacterized protein n=1 Tax=Lupinus albus TaxID=3870 RepID=A0A6A4PPL9_LUPAL|nr:hypothetical protein Lalb_Chr12g0207941 [Lupinus albus]
MGVTLFSVLKTSTFHMTLLMQTPIVFYPIHPAKHFNWYFSFFMELYLTKPNLVLPFLLFLAFGWGLQR